LAGAEALGAAVARVAARAAAAVLRADADAVFGAALAAGFFGAAAALPLPFGIAAATSEISTFLPPRFGAAALLAAAGFAAAPAALRPAAFAAGFFVVVLANLSSLVMRRRASSLGNADRLRGRLLRAGLSGYVGRARRKAQAGSPGTVRPTGRSPNGR
jgi:hypothetical protein